MEMHDAILSPEGALDRQETDWNGDCEWKQLRRRPRGAGFIQVYSLKYTQDNRKTETLYLHEGDQRKHEATWLQVKHEVPPPSAGLTWRTLAGIRKLNYD